VGSSAKMIVGRRGEGPGDGDALLLAARELARPVREAVGEPDGAITSSIQAVSPVSPPSISGSTMFSRAVSVGIRLNAWNTKPTWCGAAR
jgi:hypothetical protein